MDLIKKWKMIHWCSSPLQWWPIEFVMKRQTRGSLIVVTDSQILEQIQQSQLPLWFEIGRTRVWYALSLTLGREAWMLCCKTVKTRFALNFLSTSSHCLRQFSELDTCKPSCICSLWNLALSIKVLHKLYVKSDWFLLTLLTLYVRKSITRKAY